MSNNDLWFYGNFAFMKIPKELFFNPQYADVSVDAKMLYSLLLDRTYLSASNGEDWVDDRGNYFVILTNNELCNLYGCGHDKASRLFRELENANLIRRTVRGRGMPNRTVVLPFMVRESSARTAKFQITCDLKNRSNMAKNKSTRDRESRVLDDRNIAANNTNVNNILSNNTDVATYWDRAEVRDMIMDNICYDVITQDMGEEKINSMVRIIVDTICSNSPNIYIAGDALPRSLVTQRFLTLNDMHIRYVYDRIQWETQAINNPRGFILARLYEAQDVMDTYYQSRVQFDLSKGRTYEK